jgi:hypothetical protein
MIVAAIIPTQIGVTEGIAINRERPKLRVVAGSVMVGAGAPGEEGRASRGVASAVGATDLEAVALGNRCRRSKSESRLR